MIKKKNTKIDKLKKTLAIVATIIAVILGLSKIVGFPLGESKEDKTEKSINIKEFNNKGTVIQNANDVLIINKANDTVNTAVKDTIR
jgi:hypothetical protein